jgi:hypothetical protein
LIGDLRKRLMADAQTARNTLQRVVIRVAMRNDGGTLYLTLP